jgi:hypothetical protein
MWIMDNILAAAEVNETVAETVAETAAEVEGSFWASSEAVAIYIAIGVAVALTIAILVARKTVRTRLRMKKTLVDDPDMNDWLIIFDWTPKVLYVPTMAVSVVASILMFLKEGDVWCFSGMNAEVLGGIWFGVFFLNFLIEEYSLSIKILLIGVVSIGCLLLWLNLLGWVSGFINMFRSLALSVSGTGYLLVALIGLLTIGISWLKGLFYYVTITPNYMNLQEGPTESGEQISREDYNTRIDTSDFLERLLGFGRIIITFRSKDRQPLSLLVWRIDKRSQMLERVRGKFAIDYPQPTSRMQRSEPMPPAGPVSPPLPEASSEAPAEPSEPADEPSEGDSEDKQD